MVVAVKLLGVTGLSRKWEHSLMQAASTRASNAWDSLQSRVLAFLLAKTHGHTPESIYISYYCLIFGKVSVLDRARKSSWSLKTSHCAVLILHWQNLSFLNEAWKVDLRLKSKTETADNGAPRSSWLNTV